MNYTQARVVLVSDPAKFDRPWRNEAAAALRVRASLCSRPMCRLARGATAALLVVLSVACAGMTGAQDRVSTGLPGSDPKTVIAPRADSGTSRFARFRRYPWNSVNVWAGSAYETRSASHNEHIAGSLRIVGVQISRDVWRGAKAHLAYVGEVLPILLVRSGPPITRTLDSTRVTDAKQLDRFRFREGYGFGLAPIGAELARQLAPGIHALLNVTAGALIFNKVVPYGAATMANFTVSPGAALEWQPVSRTRVAVGYTFHHLSNASFGQSNPGMNSQILFVRLAWMKRAAAGK